MAETARDARKFRAVVKEVAGSSGGKERFPNEASCARGGPATPQDVKTICDEFNVYFASMGSRLAGKQNPSPPAEVEDADHTLDAMFELRPVTQHELFKEAHDHASLDLIIIKNWFDHSVLSVNVAKTKHLPIFMKNDLEPRTLKIYSCGDHRAIAFGCGTIERVEQHKYLGVIIDRKLSWVPHVQ
ncbi:hypothetical protein J6590_085449 [Homalodisca vitripennis]|nr:hypothetical protein J6590_085449 [Homalodisca vitripennis]